MFVLDKFMGDSKYYMATLFVKIANYQDKSLGVNRCKYVCFWCVL